ncbi:MAG: 4-hydroxy-tetrahydrodipicolinate reductase [Myxococcota bacterium]
MDTMVNIGLIGATGRMGDEVLENAFRSDAFRVVAAISSPESAGRAVGPQSIELAEAYASVAESADVLIDFSTPAGFEAGLEAAIAAGKPFVSGSTGLSEQLLKKLEHAAESVPVLLAANFSVGVNAIEQLVQLASSATGEGWDIEVFEAHHNKKVDAPSGTALFLGEAAARGRDLDMDEHGVWSREGHTGTRESSDIGFQVLRGGDIVGEHTVYFCGEGERIELTHRATDRGIFARGALRAASWIHGQPAGSYSMKDVLFG